MNWPRRIKADNINAWPLHLRGATKKAFLSFVERVFPEKYEAISKLYVKGNVSTEYQNSLRASIKNFRAKHNLYNSFVPKCKPRESEQLGLFQV